MCSAAGDAYHAGPGEPLLVLPTPTSLTRSFDGLSALMHNHPRSDPTNGDWYVLVNRRRWFTQIE